jgi:hypothetical protein
MENLNWGIIGPNVADAREELQSIEARIRAGEPIDEEEFQIAMQHAFHHLNFAWNARHWPIERYANLSDTDFKAGGRFPVDLEFKDLS